MRRWGLFLYEINRRVAAIKVFTYNDKFFLNITIAPSGGILLRAPLVAVERPSRGRARSRNAD
jgi:hypothetical protein